MRVTTSLVLGSVLLAGCAAMQSGPRPIAVADLSPTQGNKTSGTVSFVQKGGQILVDARVEGLSPGAHGFHVHEKGDCSAPDAMSAGGHFNPAGTPHGSPSHAQRHAGDFGNLQADASGRASLQLTVPATQISLEKGAPNSIIGKGLIVHADPDDYTTQPTGNAGKRLACAVISLK